MASNPSLVQYLADQCSGAGEIVARKMFGDYGLYCDGKFFGVVSDDGLYIKPTQPGRELLRVVDERPAYPGAKPSFYIQDVDDAGYLAGLVRATCSALPQPKPRLKP